MTQVEQNIKVGLWAKIKQVFGKKLELCVQDKAIEEKIMDFLSLEGANHKAEA